MSQAIAEVAAKLAELENDLATAWLRRPEVRAVWDPRPEDMTSPGAQALLTVGRSIPDPSGDLTPLLPMRTQWRKKLLSTFGDQPWFSVEYVQDVAATLARAESLRSLLALHTAATKAILGVHLGTDPSNLANELREAIAAQETASRKKAYSTRDLFSELLQDLDSEVAPGMSTGLQTSDDAHGWAELDHWTGGIRRGHVWAFGAPTNWGKSAFLLAVADRWLRHHKAPVLYLSCEDAPNILASRLMARRARVSGADLRDHSLDVEARARVNSAAGESEELEWLVDGRGVDVAQLVGTVRARMRADGVRLVLVDYLQCIRSDRYAQDRRAQINHISRELTTVIKTEGGAGILASQLTDENLRESRDLEHAAEVVIIGRQEERDGPRSLWLKKNKTGRKGAVIPVAWDDQAGAMVNMTQAEKRSEETFGDAEWDN